MSALDTASTNDFWISICFLSSAEDSSVASILAAARFSAAVLFSSARFSSVASSAATFSLAALSFLPWVSTRRIKLAVVARTVAIGSSLATGCFSLAETSSLRSSAILACAKKPLLMSLATAGVALTSRIISSCALISLSMRSILAAWIFSWCSLLNNSFCSKLPTLDTSTALALRSSTAMRCASSVRNSLTNLPIFSCALSITAWSGFSLPRSWAITDSWYLISAERSSVGANCFLSSGVYLLIGFLIETASCVTFAICSAITACAASGDAISPVARRFISPTASMNLALTSFTCCSFSGILPAAWRCVATSSIKELENASSARNTRFSNTLLVTLARLVAPPI